MKLNGLRCIGVLICLGLVYDCYPAMVAANNMPVRTSPTVMPCVNIPRLASECFKEFPPQLKETPPSVKDAFNNQRTMPKCRLFHHGIKCSKAKPAQSDNYEDMTRTFFQKYCNNTEFKKAHLDYDNCHVYIRNVQKLCTKSLKQILSGNFTTQTNEVDYPQICCARNDYENCLIRSANANANANYDSIPHTQVIVTDVHFHQCRKYDNIVRATAAWSVPAIWLSFAVLLIHAICG